MFDQNRSVIMDDDNSEDKWIAPDSTNETYPVTVPYTSASVSLYHSTFNGVSHFRSQDRYACLDEIQAFGEQFIHVCNINCKHFNVSLSKVNIFFKISK